MDVALGRRISLDELRAALQELLPGVMIHVTDDPQLSSVPYSDVLVSTTSTEAADFPMGLNVSATMTPAHDFEDWLTDLAAGLSVALRTRVLSDGSRYGDDSAPYWSLVWDAGEPFLADDCDTLVADGEGGAVRIVRPLELPRSARPSLASRVAPSGWG